MVIDRIETSAVMAEFGEMAKMAAEWERDGLGTWMYFDDPNPKVSVMIAAPKEDIDSAGCSIFFKGAVAQDVAEATARSIIDRYSLKDSQWIIADSGKKLNLV